MVSAASSYQPARAEDHVKKCARAQRKHSGSLGEGKGIRRALEGEELMKTPNHAWVRAPFRGPNADNHVHDANLCDHPFLPTVNISTS